MATESCNIPFEKGSIIIIPPGITHGSVSESGFTNISVGCDLAHLLMLTSPIKIEDNARRDGAMLARLIYENRYADESYLSALCVAFVSFLMQGVKCESSVRKSVSEIIAQIDERYCDPALDVTALLKNSGYAEDYIRSEFKKATAVTPIGFLNQLRTEKAKRLLEVYGSNRSIAEIANVCGFSDAVYFSRLFKRAFGISTDAYRKRMLTDNSDQMEKIVLKG